jgi:small subunit ribosomal protein S8
MNTSDPIADMLTRIRNSQLVNKKEVSIPYSKLKFEIAKLLKTRKFISAVEKKEQENAFPLIVVTLKKDGIKGIDRVSKPGRRVYSKSQDLPTQFKYGKGTVIVSTSKGIIDANTAKREKLGGEIICQVW